MPFGWKCPHCGGTSHHEEVDCPAWDEKTNPDWKCVSCYGENPHLQIRCQFCGYDPRTEVADAPVRVNCRWCADTRMTVTDLQGRITDAVSRLADLSETGGVDPSEISEVIHNLTEAPGDT